VRPEFWGGDLIKKKMGRESFFNIIDFFDVGLALFFIGSLGVFFLANNFISVLISIEIMLLSLNYLFVLFSSYLDDAMGQFYALCVLSVAASESSIGLSLLLIFYRVRGSISSREARLLKG